MLRAVNTALAGLDRVLLAVSGGVDSMVLLHAAAAMPAQKRPALIVASFDHGTGAAAKRALDVIDYSPRAWANAVDLETALTAYTKKASDAVFCSYNVFLTYSFLDAGFKSAGVEDPTDYHRLDLFTLAWSRLGMASLSFDQICRKLNIPPEPKPHRASTGAAKQLAVLRALLYR